MDSELFIGMPESVKAAMLKAQILIDKKRGQNVYIEGDQPQGLYFVKSGLVSLVLIGPQSGKEHLVRFFKSGQFFGHRSLFLGEGYYGRTTALEPTQLILIPKAQIEAVLQEHPQLYLQVVKVLAKELRRAELQHIMILENETLARTALALVYLKDLHPEHLWTRQEIANYCASTTSTVIKVLAELEEMRLIKQDDGRRIDIIDRAGLLRLQDETP